MRSRLPLTSTLIFLLVIGGCVRRDGRNSDCRWPSESIHHPATPRHLSADAEFAEDLAIRYADVHHGLRTPNYVSGEAYGAARDQCMQALFAEAAKEHGVPVEGVSSALGQHRGYVELAENLPFLLVYILAAVAVAQWNWRRHPLDEGWAPGVGFALFLSVLFALAGSMIGEAWEWLVEGFRVGNGHMSYRAERLVWNQHRGILFAGALMIFWLAVVEAARHVPSGRSEQ